MKDTTLSWLAGLIDGEGSIMLIPRSRRDRRAKVVVRVYNTDERLMHALVERVGCGGVSSLATPGRRKFTWQLSQTDARRVLPLLLPWLVCKRRQAEVALAVLRAKETNRPYCGHDFEPAFVEMRALNARAV